MNRLLPLPLLGALATAAVAAPAAGAAPPWSPPQLVPGSAGAVIAPSLSFGTTSAGILGWSTSERPLDVPSLTGRLAALSAAAPGPGTRDISPYNLAAPVRAYAATRMVALLRRASPRVQPQPDVEPPPRISVAFGPVDGALGRPHILADAVGPRVSDAALAVDARGDAIAAWVQSRGFTRPNPSNGLGTALNDRLWISTRRAGGSFARPTVLVGSGRLDSVDVAVGARGDMLVAFTRQRIVRGREAQPRRVEVRARRAGHHFGRVQDVGPNQGFALLATAIAPNGRAYVAWGTQDGGEEANEPFRVYAAVQPAGSSRFRPGVLLDPGSGIERPVGTVAIGVAPDATATVTWSGVRLTGTPGDFRFFFPVQAATTGAGARFGRAQVVAGGNGAVGGVTVTRAGTTTVAWTALRPGEFREPTGVLAARRPAGTAAFGPAETITDEPPVADTDPPAIGADPATGRPVVAWPGGGGLLVSGRTG